MREIKFKIKNEKGVWRYIDLRNFSEYEGYMLESYWETETLLQYTGLKDKNGKEIYEGDVVEKTCRDYFYIKELVREEEGRWLPFNRDSVHWEIIGNTHENSELLGGKNGS